MPTIKISLKTLRHLVGKRIDLDDITVAKSELDERDGDTAKIEIGDTNRPDLWCVEGIARVMRGYYGIEKGIPKIKIKKSSNKICVDARLQKIRPYISGFLVKNVKITEEFLKEIIQLQEKMAENFGKKRQKISIGIYNAKFVHFPVYYRCVETDFRFVPLESERSMTLHQILKDHPKGRQYEFILRGYKYYPILVDCDGEVLSFPPIINSNTSGKVMPGIRDLLIEVTGDNIKNVLLTANIFAQAFSDRQYSVESVTSQYPWKTPYGKNVPSPFDFKKYVSFDISEIKKNLGIELTKSHIKKLLEMMQYKASISGRKVVVRVPCYRNDIMHFVDVIEDVAIAYGYNNIPDAAIEKFTPGRLEERTLYINILRDTFIGMGFQEIMSPILSNKTSLTDKMKYKHAILEIDNVMNENYSAVRSWILPSLLQCLRFNLHIEYPQKIFEVGECGERIAINDGTKTTLKVAAVISKSIVGYDEMTSILDAFMKSIDIKYVLRKHSLPTFIQGRNAEILVHNIPIGFIGEIHPEVLNNWGLEKPVVAFEINIEEILE